MVDAGVQCEFQLKIGTMPMKIKQRHRKYDWF